MANPQLIIETAKEIMIAGMQKSDSLIYQDTSGEVVHNTAKNIADNLQIIVDGVKQAYQEMVNK